MKKAGTSDGPARMSRTAGGGATYGCHCHGKEGERGMGSRYSGGKNQANTLTWDNPSRAKAKDGSKAYPGKMIPDRWEKRTHNPSGALNMPDKG